MRVDDVVRERVTTGSYMAIAFVADEVLETEGDVAPDRVTRSIIDEIVSGRLLRPSPRVDSRSVSDRRSGP